MSERMGDRPGRHWAQHATVRDAVAQAPDLRQIVTPPDTSMTAPLI
jgi:hypothetical protein